MSFFRFGICNLHPRPYLYDLLWNFTLAVVLLCYGSTFWGQAEGYSFIIVRSMPYVVFSRRFVRFSRRTNTRKRTWGINIWTFCGGEPALLDNGMSNFMKPAVIWWRRCPDHGLALTVETGWLIFWRWRLCTTLIRHGMNRASLGFFRTGFD